MGYSRKNPLFKKNTRKFHKIVITIGISKPKTKTHAMEISHGFFYHSWKFHFFVTDRSAESEISTFCLFIQYPWKFHALNPLPVWIFLEWNGICKLIKTCHWGTVTWVIFGIWKKSKTNHVSKNSFKRHNVNYTLMKYSTYNI